MDWGHRGLPTNTGLGTYRPGPNACMSLSILHVSTHQCWALLMHLIAMQMAGLSSWPLVQAACESHCGIPDTKRLTLGGPACTGCSQVGECWVPGPLGPVMPAAVHAAQRAVAQAGWLTPVGHLRGVGAPQQAAGQTMGAPGAAAEAVAPLADLQAAAAVATSGQWSGPTPQGQAYTV